MKRSLIALATALASTGTAFAQAGPDFSMVDVRATQLAPDFWTLEGAGGTISVLAGPDGVLLVDAQYAPLTDKLVAAIRRFSDKPIRFLVNTHLHPDHVGGNENFARLGATIFARDQLRARLQHPNPAADGTPGKPAAPGALPVVTYDASLSIHLDGEEVALTAKEFDVLAYLAEDPGAVRRRTEILEHVWEGHWYGATKTVDAHVAAIRKKLGDAAWVEAVRGVGFRLGAP